MKANLGRTDRILRALLGTSLIYAGMLYSSWLILVGGIIFFTAAFSWCPIYTPFGWNTKSKSKHSA